VMVSRSSLNDMQSGLREFEKLGMVMEPKVICQRGKYHHDKLCLLVMREERLVQKKSFPFVLPDISISGQP